MAGVASSSRQRSKIAPYLMILPALVYLGIFFVVPFYLAGPNVAVVNGWFGVSADADLQLGLRELCSTR